MRREKGSWPLRKEGPWINVSEEEIVVSGKQPMM